MSYLTLQQINKWLATTKYQAASINSEMETAAASIVTGKLNTRYDIVGWVDSNSTPEIVCTVMAMLVAAWEYDKATSEDDDGGDPYAVRLERRAMALLESLASGVIDIPGVEADQVDGPVFWPSDDSTALYDSDPYSRDATPQVFSMNKVF